MTVTLGVGDVLCVRTNGWAARLIRFGAALLDRPNTVNHVIIVHHQDPDGTWWGVEGRPNGFGWTKVAPRSVALPYVVSNAEQPRTEEQRVAIAKTAAELVGTPYDWFGIADDLFEAVRLDPLWKSRMTEEKPAQVVCSSSADWVYQKCGLPSPGKTDGDWRYTTPADWATFITERGWANK